MQLKTATLIVLAIVLVAAMVSPVAAKKEKVSPLYLYEKNPADWTIVPDGAWGKMTFKDSKFDFKGHELEAGVEYALIYYPDPWPGAGLIVLGTDKSDKKGNVHISEKFNFTSIPIAGDLNAPGAKIWLVLAADQDGTKMIDWNPTEYLFENNLI
jgi:hypothetical protein